MHNNQLSMNYSVRILYYFVFVQRKAHIKRALLFQNALSRFVILFSHYIMPCSSMSRNRKKPAHPFFKMFLDRVQMFFRKIKPRMSFEPKTDHTPELLLLPAPHNF